MLICDERMRLFIRRNLVKLKIANITSPLNVATITRGFRRNPDNEKERIPYGRRDNEVQPLRV
jgi:hypothetical protein